MVSNNLNEKRTEENERRISSLFSVKTNTYYFKTQNGYSSYGQFVLNNNIIQINEKVRIVNNDYIFYFIVNEGTITSGTPIYINYIISVEDEDAYIKKCKIIFIYKYNTCFHSCETCSKDDDESNETQHNCIKCKNNFYNSPENHNNCYSKEHKRINWYLDLIDLKFRICEDECLSCSGPNNCTSCNNNLYLDIYF